MTRTIAVEVDADGHIHPLEPTSGIPRGRASLSWETSNEDAILLLNSAFAEDWDRPEEDEAWAHLQPVR